MENKNKAVSVRNEVTVDHFELGKLFAEWCDEEQVLFLLGMLAGLEDLGGLYQGIQLQLIADVAKSGGRSRDLEELADIFAYYFKTTDK